jgi:aminoglycoside phosphotransferase family enzyme/predicted kinase
VVFLAGNRAYKVKRAVKYPFLDFSTLSLRHAAALNELAVNRRTAPHLYLEVVPVTIDESGEFKLKGNGRVVEWVLVMRRFDQESLYDRLAEQGRLPLAAMTPLSETIATFHAGANRALAPDSGFASLAGVLKDNELAFAGKEAEFGAGNLEAVQRGSRDLLATLTPLLKERALGGYVRHCHGDLHLRNIVDIDGVAVLFDAIEFDDKIATIDTLYDLAFLLMDLGARRLPEHANAVLNAYLDACGETGDLIGLAALPLFLSMRAMVRAKVELLRGELAQGAAQSEAFARVASYVDLAQGYLEASRPQLIAIGGLSGSGKSTVARALAPKLGVFPGALHIRSDRERKRLFGVSSEERLPETAYRQDVSDVVYRMCGKRAMLALAGGRTVIVDAVHARAGERAAMAELASRMGARFTGIWLEAPPEIMRRRIEARAGDISDATPSVLEEQLTYDLGKQSFTLVDAGRPLGDVVAACLRVAG